MTALRSATLMVNQAARGVAPGYDWTRPVRYLKKRGVDTQLVTPGSALEAVREAEAAARRSDDALFVVGGDGSVRDAAQGLAGSETALAAIPSGTVNIWARETGVPRGLRAALDTQLAGQRVRADLGRADGRAFVLMAGVGWDAAIARRVSPRLKAKVGDLAYMVEAVRQIPRLRTVSTVWHASGARREEPLAWMVLSNTRLNGGRIELSPGALADDGLLELVALCPARFGDGTRLALKAALHRLEGDARAVVDCIEELAIETAGLPVQLDGDYVGQTPMTFRCEPRALLVSVPAGPLTNIFARPGSTGT
jgi:YegS/Rv2252/BmrU family lipid kinase